MALSNQDYVQLGSLFIHFSNIQLISSFLNNFCNIFNIFKLYSHFFCFFHLKAESSLDKLHQICSSDDGWTFVKEKDGVAIHSRYQEDNSIIMFVFALLFNFSFFFYSSLI